MLRRFALQRRKPRRQHFADFGEGERADGGHRAEFGEEFEHAFGMTQHTRRERFQVIEPVAPRGGGREVGKVADDR